MGITRRRKFVCLECGEYTYFTKCERDRRAIIRCIGCGSAQLEPATIGAKRDILKKNEIRKSSTPKGVIVSKLKLKAHKSLHKTHGELDNQTKI